MMMNSGQGMTRLSNMLYINFPVPKDGEEGINVRSCIAGHVGSGKTTFINKMCNKRYETGCDVFSVTKDITYEDSIFVTNSRFRFYDTPGYNSQSEAFRHALTLRATLTKIPYNLILIQVSFQSRFHDITKKIKDQLKFFKDYYDYVVFMVSKFDMCLQQIEQSAKKFGEFIQSLGLKFKFILYSNAKTDFKILSKLLYNIAVKNKPKLVQIDDDKFYQYFNISSSPQNVKHQKIQKYIDEIEQQSQHFTKYIKQLKKIIEKDKGKTTDIDELISQFKLYMKWYLNACQERQYKEYMNGLSDLVAFDLYLTNSKIVHSRLQQVDQVADLILTRKYYDQYTKKEEDIRDFFKKCPKCGKIWMKVQGCNGITYCGTRPQYFDYTSNQSSYRYQFQLQNGKLIQKKNPKYAPIPYKKNLNSQQKSLQCSQRLVWSSLPRIDNIDQILKQLYSVNNYTEIKLEFQRILENQKVLKRKLEEQVRVNQRKIEEDKMRAEHEQEIKNVGEVQKMYVKCAIM